MSLLRLKNSNNGTVARFRKDCSNLSGVQLYSIASATWKESFCFLGIFCDVKIMVSRSRIALTKKNTPTLVFSRVFGGKR